MRSILAGDHCDFSVPIGQMNGAKTVDTCGQHYAHPTFHVHEHARMNGHCNVAANVVDSGQRLPHKHREEDDHPFDISGRDFRDPRTSAERKIISSKGTVRGIKNRVRAGIARIGELQNQSQNGSKQKNYKLEEKGRIVLYSTSMMIIRETCENCKKVRQMLQTHMLQFEERDIFMSREIQKELLERLQTDKLDVPQLFADGQHIGGVDEIEKLNESGELRRIFQSFKRVNKATSCESCGGYRFLPCTTCHGSKKSLHRNHFTEEFCALRCTVCDENGLIKCDVCQEPIETGSPH